MAFVAFTLVASPTLYEIFYKFNFASALLTNFYKMIVKTLWTEVYIILWRMQTYFGFFNSKGGYRGCWTINWISGKLASNWGGWMILHLYGLRYDWTMNTWTVLILFYIHKYIVIFYSIWREMRLHAIVVIANSVENVLIKIIIKSDTVKSTSSFGHLLILCMFLW